MTRYHPALVALHWLIGLMVAGSLIVGKTALTGTPNTDPAKVQLLLFHMAGGMAILALMLIRLLVRWRTPAPPEVDTGNALLNLAGQVSHASLYLLVIGMSLSGFALSLVTGLPDIVFGGSGVPLPATFNDYASKAVHALLSGLLIALIALHVLAALWHQFIRKDNLLQRMWFRVR